MKLVEILILAGVSAAIASGGAVVKISKDRKEAKRKLERYTEEEKEAERQNKEKAAEEEIEKIKRKVEEAKKKDKEDPNSEYNRMKRLCEKSNALLASRVINIF